MDIVVKSGRRVWRKYGYTLNKISKMMDKILEEHPHICANCSSNACIERRSIHSSIVVRGIRAMDRDYIFDCIGYIPKKFDYNGIESDETTSTNDSLVKYMNSEYRIVHPVIKQIVYKMK